MKPIFLFLLCSTACLLGKEQHPIRKVNQWFTQEKERSEGSFRKFATLATVSSDGSPHTRMVELVGINRNQGALFFTNKNSNKVSHLSGNPLVALNIWLPKTLRQISLDGIATQIPTNDAEKSWKRMPRFMKLAFIISNQGEEEVSDATLKKRKENLDKLYPKEIPMPEAFVGYRIVPNKITFYEIRPRTFAIKHVAHLENHSWNICQVEP